MSRLGIVGLESGDIGELVQVTTFAVATDQTKTGGYSAKASGGGGAARVVLASSTTVYAKAYVRFTNSADPGAPTVWNGLFNVGSSVNNTGPLASVQAIGNATGGYDLRLVDSVPTVIGSSVNVAKDAWHRVELKVVKGTGAGDGVAELKVNGTSIASSSSCNTGTLNAISGWFTGVTTTTTHVGTGFSVWYDDISIDNAAFPGASEIVRLPGVSTAPTHNAWTKSNGSTINTVWNDVPFNTATSANSGSTTGTPSQTMLFDSSGLSSSVTINGTAFGFVGKTSAGTQSGGNYSFREIVNGSTVDTPHTDTIGTSDLYRGRLITAVPTYAQLATVEAGIIKATSGQARTQTLEDLWLSVDYTPSSGTTATLSKTEDSDTTSSAGALAIAATVAKTEASDSVSATATLAIAATASITEASDTLAATAGSQGLTADASITEAADSVAATAANAIAASVSKTETGDTSSATAALAIAATLSKTEASDSVSATAAAGIAATAAISESSDSLSSASALAIAANASVTEAADSLSATASSSGEIVASASITEASDSVSSTATNRLAVALAVIEAGDIVVSTGALAIAAALSVTEQDDDLVAAELVVQESSGAFFMLFQ